jgi:hypothetical protein
MARFKLCCEASCNHVYEPDAGEGRCPKCGSEGLWLSNTVLGRRSPLRGEEGRKEKDDDADR